MTSHSTGSASHDKQVFAIAYFHARRIGLPREEAKDCSMEFMGRLLTIGQRSQAAIPTGSAYVPWLHRCARNHACNYLRKLVRRRQAERSWTDSFGSSAQNIAQSCPSAAAGPRTLALRKELWQQVRLALKQLSPSQRDLFVRYHLRNYSIRDLAARFGRTEHAVEESLSNTRKRLAVLLAGQGWTDSDIRTLFRASIVTVVKT